MTRLFLSLYAFITITLVVLSAVLNHFFFNNNGQAESNQYLVNSLTHLYQQNALNEKELAQIGLNSRQVNINNIPWQANDRTTLAAQKPILLYSSNSLAQLYYQLDANTLIEIDLPSHNAQQDGFYWYSAVFFALLALGTAIWIWPLWRDLQALKRAAKHTNLSEDFEVVGLQKHSLVYPIGQALDELKAKVRELIKTQMELTGAVAHEFRTPLSRLKFALDAVNIDEKVLVAIKQDILELEKLMHEMLSYTSLENHEPELNISEIPLLSLCQQRVDACLTATRTNINILVKGNDQLVLADEHYLERAVDNLIQNAIRHAKSQVEITVSGEGENLLLTIDDDGSGIAAEHLSKIFEPFFRPDHSRDRNRGGAGLGLAIVKRIIIWHSADCWAKASPLGGARFCIAFTKNPM